MKTSVSMDGKHYVYFLWFVFGKFKSFFVLNNQFFIGVASYPNLLAWCSQLTNMIGVCDLETNQEYAEFNGASLDIGDCIFAYFFKQRLISIFG